MSNESQSTTQEENTVEISVELNNVLLNALEEAKKKLLEKGQVMPFTALSKGPNLIFEPHPFEDLRKCHGASKMLVESLKDVATAYGFCYDTYVNTPNGRRDILICEGGELGQARGHALGYIYYPMLDGKEPEFDADPVYLGNVENFFDSVQSQEE